MDRAVYPAWGQETTAPRLYRVRPDCITPVRQAKEWQARRKALPPRCPRSAKYPLSDVVHNNEMHKRGAKRRVCAGENILRAGAKRLPVIMNHIRRRRGRMRGAAPGRSAEPYGSAPLLPLPLVPGGEGAMGNVGATGRGIVGDGADEAGVVVVGRTTAEPPPAPAVAAPMPVPNQRLKSSASGAALKMEE